MEKLKTLIYSISNKSFQNIKKLIGNFQFPQYVFNFLKIQGSSGANPASIASVKVLISEIEFPDQFLVSAHYRLAVADFLIRRFNDGINKFAQQNRGKNGSGSLHTISLSQKMLERDCVIFSKLSIELRFEFSLPATGSGAGQFDADQAWLMFEEELTPLVEYALCFKKYDEQTRQLLNTHIEIQQQRKEINDYLLENGYCVFINNGARLPRKSGIDDQPALADQITEFLSPTESQVEIPLSGNTTIQGMAIREGITCITGGGFHGKSTLLQAILSGVYAHIPGDGREYIVTREDAVFIRAEEGRSIKNVNISAFIGQLPSGLTTERFSSDNASGSTSQAASIIESLETGSRLLLLDEDNCATNFLVRDELISKVTNQEHEPIKPLYSTVRSLWKHQGVSMIFVVGGLGVFLQKADTCLLMNSYQCFNITSRVRLELGKLADESESNLDLSDQRQLSVDNFDPSYTNVRLKKRSPKRIKDLRNAPRQLEYGMDLINLEALPQIVEAPQILSIGYGLLILRLAMQADDNQLQTIEFWLEWLYQKLEQQGLSFLNPDYPGTLSMPRKYEMAAAINRIRSLKILE